MYHFRNHIREDDLFFGSMTASIIAKVKTSVRSTICSQIKDFYITAVDYLLLKFPIDSHMLKAATVADISTRAEAKFEDLNFFATRIGVNSIDELRESFRVYQVSDLPSHGLSDRIDTIWHQLRQYQDPIDGSKPYHLLATFMLGILCIPHSNADSERIFSIVRKNRTEFRASMSTETLAALLTNKLGGRVDLGDAVLKKCKRATLHYNNLH